MNFKILKLICITLLVVMIITVPTESQAFGDIINKGKNFISVGEGNDPIIDDNALKTTSDVVFMILLAIAIIIAIIWGAYLGIHFMMEGAEGKAQIKEALLPYVVGCIVAFGSVGIWKVVVVALQNSGL